MTARRPGRRVTDYLSARQVNELQVAAGFADMIGFTLNLHATIAWEHTKAVDDPDGRLLFGVLEGVRKMFQRRDIPQVWVWSRKRQYDGHASSEHAHILLHLSPHLLVPHRRKHIAAIFNRQVENQAGHAGDRAVWLEPYDRCDIRYLLKGARQEVLEDLRLPKHWRVWQGEITGKRAGFSQNLGPKARQRFWAKLNGAPTRKVA